MKTSDRKVFWTPCDISYIFLSGVCLLQTPWSHTSPCRMNLKVLQLWNNWNWNSPARKVLFSRIPLISAWENNTSNRFWADTSALYNRKRNIQLSQYSSTTWVPLKGTHSKARSISQKSSYPGSLSTLHSKAAGHNRQGWDDGSSASVPPLLPSPPLKVAGQWRRTESKAAIQQRKNNLRWCVV